MMGLDAISSGAVGIADGTAKWIGGFLIFGFLAGLSIPIGLLVRAAVGLLPMKPLLGAVLTGAAVGLALIPVLNPAMYPDVSFQSDPFRLVLVHASAGVVGGLVWWSIECPASQVSHE